MNNWQWEARCRTSLLIFSAVSECETILSGHCVMWPGILYSYKMLTESERTQPFTPHIGFKNPFIHSCLSLNQQLSLHMVWFTLRTVYHRLEFNSSYIIITLKNCLELWYLLTHHPPGILASSEMSLLVFHSAWHHISDDSNLYWTLILKWHGWQLEKILYYVYSVWEYKGCQKVILPLKIINLTVSQQCMWAVTIKQLHYL
jgi:hypothetical protein